MARPKKKVAKKVTRRKKTTKEVGYLMPAVAPGFWVPGTKYFIRTVTMFVVGTLKSFSCSELVLENAAWVADCGAFTHALETGELSECEPFLDDVLVNRTAIVDATLWRHAVANK